MGTMKTNIARCRQCGHEFRAEILDREEARDPSRLSAQLRCELCRSTDLDHRVVSTPGEDSVYILQVS